MAKKAAVKSKKTTKLAPQPEKKQSVKKEVRVDTLILRSIVETKDVVKNQLATTILEELLSQEKLTFEECQELTLKLQAIVELQSNGLIDRVQKQL